jgi:DNA-binding SARP family transcriptional activator
MGDSAIPIIPRMNRFDASIIEYTMQYVLISKFPNTTYDTAPVGKVDGLCMFSFKYSQPADCIPFAKVEDTIVYIHTIRRKLIVGKVSAEKVRIRTIWMEMFQKLVAYKKNHMSTNVPQNFKKDPKLGKWVTHQRTHYKNKRMTAERINCLDSIGFIWDLCDVQWMEMYQKLVANKKNHMSTNVPQNFKKDPKLGKWVSTQRRNYNDKNKRMTAERINHLDSIGFIWDLRDAQWMEMYQKLVAYKKNHNMSTNVPRYFKEDPKLGDWVSTQRTYYNNENKKLTAERINRLLTAERINRLDSIGFIWDLRDAQWMEMYQKLVAYKKNHKSINVPDKCPADPKLGNWVSTQRAFYNNKRMTAERFNHLDSIGFIWDPHGAQWMQMYNRLVTYKKKYNSTIIPQYFKTDPTLGMWVSTQRRYYNNGKMLGKHLELLKSINFAWSTKSGSH